MECPLEIHLLCGIVVDSGTKQLHRMGICDKPCMTEHCCKYAFAMKHSEIKQCDIANLALYKNMFQKLHVSRISQLKSLTKNQTGGLINKTKK